MKDDKPESSASDAIIIASLTDTIAKREKQIESLKLQMRNINTITKYLLGSKANLRNSALDKEDFESFVEKEQHLHEDSDGEIAGPPSFSDDWSPDMHNAPVFCTETLYALLRDNTLVSNIIHRINEIKKLTDPAKGEPDTITTISSSNWPHGNRLKYKDIKKT